ncbi:uncharacterized protein FOMMEDRAFT_36524, partial [Fomitiporia mediterranea MF3/22]|uniref:uncharacterized protein n=1 Tax=Fomitiporia mediterranea (strain MF3/22) TaxID=694068 RepID=UPI0004408434
MEYKPKHAQPFTYAQAHRFETPTITEEITRLENSLFHLNRTQVELNAHLTGSPEEDRELLEAITENEAVIGSQTERISMLKLVLEERGITANSEHY